MTFEIEGLLHKKFETESKSSSFQAREFVITTEGTYPQFIKFQLTQDKCGLIDTMEEGETIKVSFDLRGREWQGKYFTNLNAWRVDKAAAPNNGFQDSSIPSPPVFDNDSSSVDGGLPEDFNDLPF